ncbi:hypothetical protein GH714_026553 [Hevea brasiliensis]|uniref:Uncharacterized protein n=1 Tax=Hevea brasiliensis TaxID=3981 RepID=A0A6A6MPW0_HEVBR|nr:hypothetical protein GH714_026553 [Hevea brasiliensis]
MTAMSTSGRNRGPPFPLKGLPHAGLPPAIHEPHFGRGLGTFRPHPVLLEEKREIQYRIDPRQLPSHPATMEERLAAQNQNIQGLLADNQRLAATHVALKHELEAAQHELQWMTHFADSLHVEKDMQRRELHEKSLKLEADLRKVEAMHGELHHIFADIRTLVM